MGAARRQGRVLAAIGATAVFGVLAAGCGSSGDADTAASGSEDVVEVDIEDVGPADSGGSSEDQNRKLLAGALGGKDTVVCDFTEAGTAGKMYIQGESKFRFEGLSEDGPILMVRDGDTLYMWEPNAAAGLAINVASQGAGDEVINPQDLEDSGAVNDLQCEKYTGDMAILSAPEDVEFSSLEDMLGGAMNREQIEKIFGGAGEN